MVLELVIPEFDKKSNVKDYIISCLTDNWPLSIKKIHNEIKKRFKFNGTYQAVFKATNELLNKKVIIKNQTEYELNMSWVKKLQGFTDTLETNYYLKNREDIYDKNNSISIMSFSSIFDMEKYLYYFVKNILKKTENEKVVYEMNNFWKVLFYYRAEYNYYTKLSKLGHKFYFFGGENSEIENQAREFYKKIGIKIKKGNKEIMDKIIFGEYYIEILIPKPIQKKISELLKEGNKFNLLMLLDSEIEGIKIVIHKDKNLAEEIMKKILEK